MALAKGMKVLWVLRIACFGICCASVYKVGDTNGWIKQDYDYYSNWASTKNFQIGDTIVFEYNAKEDDVIQVKHEDFQSCNAKEPTSKHNSGNDSITIEKNGHHLFISGSHCKYGQKVDINVQLKTVSSISAAPAPSPSTSPSPAPSPTLSSDGDDTDQSPIPSNPSSRPRSLKKSDASSLRSANSLLLAVQLVYMIASLL